MCHKYLFIPNSKPRTDQSIDSTKVQLGELMSLLVLTYKNMVTELSVSLKSPPMQGWHVRKHVTLELSVQFSGNSKCHKEFPLPAIIDSFHNFERNFVNLVSFRKFLRLVVTSFLSLEPHYPLPGKGGNVLLWRKLLCTITVLPPFSNNQMKEREQ